MSNSSLVTCTKLTKNCTKLSNKVNDTVTIHCIVGQWTAQQGLDFFAKEGRQASANYVVGKDGSIGLCVEEKNRAWTTGGTELDHKTGMRVPIRVNGISGADQDHNAITIEVASDTTHPYAITDAAMEALIKLLVDICQRNPTIGRLRWKADKSLVGKPEEQNMTVHRWFAHKVCPGDYIYTRLGDIAAEVNRRLEEEENAMTEEKIRKLIQDTLAAELPKAVAAAIDEINPIIKDLDNVPDYWKDVARVLLDTDAVNGGTPREVNATDMNLRLETLKAAVIAVNYHKAAPAEPISKGPEISE